MSDWEEREQGEDTADRSLGCALVLLLFALLGSGICGGFLLRR